MTDLSALLGAKLFEVARADIETAGLLNKPKRNIIRWLTVKFIFTRPRLLRFVGRLLYCYQAPASKRWCVNSASPLCCPKVCASWNP